MIIIASKPGQLGNSLFLFAHFIAFAQECDYEIANFSFNDYAKYFEEPRKDIFCRFPSKKHPVSDFMKAGKIFYKIAFYSARVIHKLKFNNIFVQCIYLDWDETFNLEDPDCPNIFSKSRFIFIQGWRFRCPEYAKKNYTEIKKYFSPLKVHNDNIKRLISDAKKNCDLLIGIHIRHGDYARFEGGKYFFTIEQYKKNMLKSLKLFPNKRVRFLICTNSKENLSALEPLDFIKGNNHELEDLYSFAQCDYLIGPPSTYTMWSSYYGKVPLYQMKHDESDFILNDFKTIIHD